MLLLSVWGQRWRPYGQEGLRTIRFGVFEADLGTEELRKQGRRAGTSGIGVCSERTCGGRQDQRTEAENRLCPSTSGGIIGTGLFLEDRAYATPPAPIAAAGH